MKVLCQVIAQNELIVGMNMNKPVRLRIIGIIVKNTRKLFCQWGPRLLKSQPVQNNRKTLRITTTDQEIKIVFTTGGTVEDIIALPVAIGDTFIFQCLTEPLDGIEYDRMHHIGLIRFYGGAAFF
jgi:hypothetical protein